MYAMLAYPLAHFAVFWIGVNFNSILLAFQVFNSGTTSFNFLPAAQSFSNFAKFAKDLFTNNLLKTGAKNSGILFLVGLLFSTPVNITLAYFIYKKVPMWKFFRDILFLTSIISSIVWVLIFKYFFEYGIPIIAKKLGYELPVLLIYPTTAFPLMILYGLWTGFGGGLLLYVNAMVKIPDSLTEYGRIEGMNARQEIRYLILPFIYPLLTTFLVVSVADFFLVQGPLFAFYDHSAPSFTYTIGYFMFTQVFRKDASNMSGYPYIASGGLLFTAIAAPVTLLVKWALEKFGPDVKY